MDKNSALYGIAYGCPKNIRISNCPLLEIEHLSFREKLDWINQLSNKSKESVISHHSFCSQRKKDK